MPARQRYVGLHPGGQRDLQQTRGFFRYGAGRFHRPAAAGPARLGRLCRLSPTGAALLDFTSINRGFLAMPDRFQSHAPGLEAPASHGFAITPSDSDALSEVARALYVGGAGAVAVVLASGASVTLSGI